jgi:hypothetical protein
VFASFYSRVIDNGIEFTVCFQPCFTDLDGYGMLLGDMDALEDDPSGPINMVLSTVAPKLPKPKKLKRDHPAPALLDGPIDDEDGVADHPDHVRSLLDEVV